MALACALVIPGLAVAEAPPASTDVERWEGARSALRYCDIDGATAAAERALAAKPDSLEALAMLADLYDALGNEKEAGRIYRALKKAGGRPALPPLAPRPVETVTTGLAHVQGLRVRLRAAPSTSAPVLEEMLPNDKVEVLSVDGAWARVRFTEPGVAGVLEGHVSTAFLGATALDAAAVMAEAKQRLAGGQPRDALERWELRRAMSPPAEGDDDAFFAAAFRTGSYALWLRTICRAQVPPAAQPMEATVNVHAWPRMTNVAFGCMLERKLGVKDASFDCSSTRVEKGSPCFGKAWYAGPQVPRRAAKRIHPRITAIRLEWEHADLRTAAIEMEPGIDQRTLRRIFGLSRQTTPGGFFPTCNAAGCSLTLDAFEHMGAGDVECP